MPEHFFRRPMALNRFLVMALLQIALIFILAPAAYADLFLWRSQSDAPQIYIMGSVHALSKKDYPLPGPYERAFEQSQKVVFEVDLSAQSTAKATALMFDMAALPEGKTLKDILGDKRFERLNKIGLKQGYSLEMMNAFEPWFASLMASQILFSNSGLDVSLGVDQHYRDKAKRRGKSIGHLETAKEQFEIFDEMNMRLQVAFLETAIMDFKEGKAMLDGLMKAWRAGDDKVLSEVMIKEMQKYPGLAESLLYKRNRNWAEQVDDYFKGRTDTLVVVGAAHLVGPNNLIELMEEKGYQFERVDR